MSSTARRRVFLLLILLQVLSVLSLVFGLDAIVFWAASAGVIFVAATIPAKELYEKDKKLFWLIVPAVLAAISLGCIGSFFLLPLLRK